jgi:hypothetical protein
MNNDNREHAAPNSETQCWCGDFHWMCTRCGGDCSGAGNSIRDWTTADDLIHCKPCHSHHLKFSGRVDMTLTRVLENPEVLAAINRVLHQEFEKAQDDLENDDDLIGEGFFEATARMEIDDRDRILIEKIEDISLRVEVVEGRLRIRRASRAGRD